jgi:pSer/pThr/pTyr-binding forkhead associated (FHA) protein
MSSRHAVLERKSVKGKTQWSLVDLKSTNGTYVRVSNALLEDGSEFIIGRTRFRFEKPPTAAASATRPDEQKTQLWQQPATGDAAPALVELTNDGPGRRLLVNHPETWIGKDTARCQMVLSADPFASARHARIRQDDEGRWVLENNKSINGVWFKVPQIVIKNSCRFMLGEQQFAVQLPK